MSGLEALADTNALLGQLLHSSFQTYSRHSCQPYAGAEQAARHDRDAPVALRSKAHIPVGEVAGRGEVHVPQRVALQPCVSGLVIVCDAPSNNSSASHTPA